MHNVKVSMSIDPTFPKRGTSFVRPWMCLCIAVLLPVMGMLFHDSIAHSETLIVGGTQAPGTLGNPYGSSGQPASMVWSAIYDGLTDFDVSGKMTPALATTWSTVDDLTWRFELRRDVHFHNGKSFNADAVAGTFAYLLSDAGRTQLMASRLSMIERVEVVSDYTVEFKTRFPDAILPKRLSLVMIVEPETWATISIDAYALEPIGTGPYKLVQWGAGNARIVMAASNASWRNHGAVDRVELRPLADPASRLQALMSGQVDIVWNIDPDVIALLESNGLRATTVDLPNVLAIALRTEGNPDSPMQDLRVRKALNYAVDKGAMADLILSGLVNPATQGATVGTVGFDATIEGYPYDPDRARALLAEAGYPDGFAFTIELTARLLPGDTLIFQKMAADLAAVGVDVEIRDLPLAAWTRKYVANDWGQTDAFSMTWNSAPMYDSIRPFEYYSCIKINPFFCDQDLAHRIVASNSVMDPGEREAVMRSIMADTVDAAPSIFLTEVAYIVGLSDRIDNFSANAMGIRYEEVTFH